MADENEETPLEETPLVETPPAGETPPTVETPAGEVNKDLLDLVTAAVDNTAPRSITPKGDEQNQDDTRPRNADGTFKAETDEEKAAREAADAKAIALKNETPEQKTAREAAEAAEAAKKTPDPVNDPIPEGLNKRTAERMKSLIETVKAQEAIVESHTQLFDVVREAGTPEEFSAMIQYMKGAKSNDPKVLEQAYAVLQSELRGLAVRMGKPLYEVNLLRDPTNKDLVEEIANGTLTNQRAHELALQRESNRVRQGQTRQTEESQQTEREKAEGIETLNQLERDLVKRDGVAAYKAKRDVLESTLQEVMASVSPKRWREVFTRAYDNLKIAVPTAAPAPAPAPAPSGERPQPQRPKQPAGSGEAKTAPKSALEALSQAIGG